MNAPRNHITLQPGYILHSTPYRDTSALLEVFTPDYGRIGLVARGVRSARSRLRGVLQPFRPLLISWYSKSDLGTLTSAEANLEAGGAAAGLAGRNLMSGFYLNELLLRLLHRHDPHPASFHHYDTAVRALAVADESMLQQALRSFEKELLQDIGYGLVLDHDVITGQPVMAAGMYRYHLEKGPERMECVTAEHLANTLGIVLHGHTLLRLAYNDLRDPMDFREARQLLRKALEVHLGRQPLRSRALYNEMLELWRS